MKAILHCPKRYGERVMTNIAITCTVHLVCDREADDNAVMKSVFYRLYTEDSPDYRRAVIKALEGTWL